MSDNSSPTNECTSCQLFLRVGIPVVVVFIILVIGCIIWFDRYDKNQLQKKLQEKREKKLQTPQNSSDDHSVDIISNEETDLSIYTIPSSSVVDSTKPSRPSPKVVNDLNSMERGSSTVASKSPCASTNAVVVPTYRTQRFHTLIQQVHDENVMHLPMIVQDTDEEMGGGEIHDGDDQSSIESDATPIVTNNNNNNHNSSSQQATDSEEPVSLTTFIVQLPPSKDLATHAEIGLIRNNLSIPGTTESESTSSSSSTSSCSCRSSSSGGGTPGMYDITV